MSESEREKGRWERERDRQTEEIGMKDERLSRVREGER